MDVYSRRAANKPKRETAPVHNHVLKQIEAILITAGLIRVGCQIPGLRGQLDADVTLIWPPRLKSLDGEWR